MGISKAVGSMATAFLLASLYMIKSGTALIAAIPLLYDSFIAYVVTFASHPSVDLPLILGKDSAGRFPLWSKILFGPFLVFARLYVMFKRVRRRGREPVYSEIAEGLFVGGWPTSPAHLPPGNPAVIDCTCELPRSDVVDECNYLCVPTWDTRSPLPPQIEGAVQWACRLREQKKPIFVHCAFGEQTHLIASLHLLVQ